MSDHRLRNVPAVATILVSVVLAWSDSASAGMVGNSLTPRSGPGDTGDTIFFTNFVPMPIDGPVDAVGIYSQGAADPFRMLQLRPTGSPNQYTLLYDSGSITPPGTLNTVVTIPLPGGPVAAQTGDLFAHYGHGIPYSTAGGLNADNPHAIYYSVNPASIPTVGGTITLGSSGFPLTGYIRDYAWAVNMPTLPITGGMGPGGFTPLGPTSDITLWVKGDAGITQDGSGVSNWADQSGRGNDLVQATNANKPLQNVTINGVAAITFDGDGTNSPDFLEFSNTVPAQSIFFVSETIDLGVSGTNPDAIFGGGTSGPQSGYHNPSLRRNDTTKYRGNTTADGYDFTYPTGSEFRVNSVLTDLAADGVTHIATAVRGSGSANWNANKAVIGLHQDRAWHGVMGEVIMFNRMLNSAERLLVENHLSAKYNVGSTSVGPDNTLGANDFYAGDTTANGDYDLDVFGIGRLGVADQVPSAGSQGFGISSAALEDGEWVLAGHNSPANSWVTTDLPPGGVARWERVWYVDETGDVDVKLAFDFSDGGLSAPDPGAQLSLLYSPTNAFSFSAVAFYPTVNGDMVTFDLSGASLRDGYYTLGIVPEPGTLALLGLGGVALLLPRVLRRRRR